ncbi:MAG TPA: hypothetical protein VFT00_08065 [Nocardioides sp.]|nr:hypothetical protein [Nocardioides sp.]
MDRASGALDRAHTHALSWLDSTWRGRAALRISVSNRSTSDEDVRRTLAALTAAASEASSQDATDRGSATAPG